MFGHNAGNSTIQSWRFDRFKAGTLDITLTLAKDLPYDTLFEVVLYDDQPSSWPRLYANKSNACWYNNNTKEYRLNTTLAREASEVRFIDSYDQNGHDGNATWTETINIHEHVVPRWWWVYLVKCDFAESAVGDFIGHDIHFKMHWQQDDIKWNAELSLNDEYQNTFHCVIPWLTLCLFIVQCVSYGMYWNETPNKGYVHIIIKLLTLLIFLQFISSLFKMSYWLHLTYSGWKEFGVLTFSFLFEISANVLFLYLLFSIFAFGWRMSVGRLNKKLNYTLIGICVVIECIDFIIFVWSYEYYPDEEKTLYRYSEKPQVTLFVYKFTN